jgi:hypothetical protein
MATFHYTPLTAEQIGEIVKDTKVYNAGALDKSRPAFDDRLIGKRLDIQYDNGLRLNYIFDSLHSLTWWTEDSSELHMEYYECLAADENILQVTHLRKGTFPQQSVILAIDLDTRLVTTFFCQFGNEFAAREVTRDIVFGYLIEEGKEAPEERHSLTSDLVGRSIIWTYHSDFIIQHVYTSPYYSAFMDFSTFYGGVMIPAPCSYVKLNDHVYIYSWVETEASGTQGFCLMNLFTMHDVGCFFGINMQDHFEFYTFGATGEFAGQLVNFNFPVETPLVFGPRKEDA